MIEENKSEDLQDQSPPPNENTFKHECFQVLSQLTCYDLMCNSTRIIITDVRLKATQAFNSLRGFGIRASLLWDQRQNCFVGVFTVTDFMKMLEKYYNDECSTEDVEMLSLKEWREHIYHNKGDDLVSINPDATLDIAARFLCSHAIHRLPVIDRTSGSPLDIVTHKKILSAVFQGLNTTTIPSFLHTPARSLGVGTYLNLVSVRKDSLIKDAINKMISLRVSALPVVNDSGKVTDLYSKADIINLALDRSYANKRATVAEGLANRRINKSQLFTCASQTSLFECIRRLIEELAHRLIVVDKNGLLDGVISLSDIVRFILNIPN